MNGVRRTAAAIFYAAVLAVGGAAVGLKKMNYDRIPQAGILSASFFVVSLVHVPLGAGSVHLTLNGLVGLIMGWAAFPIILVGLTLQAVFFQFGGITTLGTNTVIMARPAVVCYLVFGRLGRESPRVALFAAFACGFCSVFLAVLILAGSLFLTGEEFLEAASLLVVAHVPVMILEGLVTAFCVGFLQKVQPSMLQNRQSGAPT